MKLITRQSLDFDITKDLVDLTKSEYFSDYNDNVFKKAYTWLFNQINHDKFVWCYKGDTYLPKSHGQEFIEWHLDVPLSECVLINSEVWNLVINDMPYFIDMNSPDISDDEFNILMEFYRHKKEQTWIENIFRTEDISNDDIEVLVKSPVLDKFVIDKFWCSSYDNEEFSSGILNNFFRTEEKALRIKEIMEYGLKCRKKPFTSSIEKNNRGFILKMEWEQENE